MRGEDFEAIKDCLGGRLVDPPDYDAALQRFPWVSRDTLVSIHSQESVARIKRAHGHHRRPDRLRAYRERWLAGESLVAIAMDLDFPPCALARLMLPGLLARALEETEGWDGPVTDEEAAAFVSHEIKLSKCLAEPDLLLRALTSRGESDSASPPAVGETARRIASELAHCAEADHLSSPRVASVRRAIGLHHEEVLCLALRDARIPFESEEQLREKGATKTPDVLLEVPIDVAGSVVHWIDSKACFGSPDVYVNEGLRQFRQYVNRFGPGMVVYWFGFVDEIPKEESVLVRDSFPPPSQIMCLPRADTDDPWDVWE